MERISIITPDGDKIKSYLDANMENIETTTFIDVFEFFDRVKQSAYRSDTLLIMDNGLKDNRYGADSIDTGAARLKEVLADMPLVEIERVIYLNLEKNPKHYELMEFLRDSKYIKATIILAKYPEYKAITIKELLVQNSQTYGGPNNKYKHVVRKNRNERTSSRILNQFETNKAVILEHRTANPNVDFIKEQIDEVVGEEPITTEITDEEVIGNIDIDANDETETPIAKPEIIAVVGESKSGASVTSMIMAASGSVFNQTLLVDMNYTNLGLSYLVEKTLVEDEINNIKLEDIIVKSEGTVSLREAVYKKNSLHILTNSMPAKAKMNISEFGFLIANILKMYKKSYRYIILDVPIDEMEYYAQAMTMVDKVIMCTPPYMNNIISLMSKVSKSPLMKAPAFSEIENNQLKDVVLLRTKIFSRVNREIKPVKIEVINRYARELIKSELKVTGVYLYTPKSYLDTILFKSILAS